MLAYAWADQRSAALLQYRSCVRILDEELGVAPLPETTEVAALIRENHTPSLPSIAEQAAQPTRRTTRLASSTGPAYPLVGRVPEWAALAGAYAQAREGGRLVVLEGEAGIGKTRLAETFVADVRDRGGAVIIGRCYEGESNLAYEPITGGLRAALTHKDSSEQLRAVPDQLISEAARLVPELATLRPGLPPPIGDTANTGTRLVEALRQLLAAMLDGDPPGVLLIDDLQWADEASVRLLRSLVRRLPEVRLLVLARSDEVPAWHPARQLLANAAQAGVTTTLTLPRLTRDDVAKLVIARVAAADAPVDLAHRLYEATEGVPMLLVAYLDLYAGETPSSDVIPASIRDLLRARLTGLSELARQILATAATAGHSFYFETLRDAGGRGEDETVAALDELVERHLVREVEAEHGSLRFDFTHDQLRRVVYQDMSMVRRRLLHRRVAEAVLRGGPSRFDNQLAQIATHYQLAGQDNTAADYFRQAGDHARTLHANAEALAHYQAALALGHPDAAYLHEAVGDVLTLTASYASAITNYDLVAAHANGVALAPIERKLANVYVRQGAWDLAESHFQAALGASAEYDSGECARILAAWSLMLYRRGELDQAGAMARRALDAAVAANDTHVLAECHNIIGLIARHQGKLDEAARHLQSSLELASDVGDLAIRVAALNNLALMYATRDQAEHGLELLESALQLCRALGDRHHEAALLTNMADLLRLTGNTDAAVDRLKQAVPILADVGAASGPLQPEIWKLTEW
jgi:predicted ATPase